VKRSSDRTHPGQEGLDGGTRQRITLLELAKEAHSRSREYLTPDEVERMIAAAMLAEVVSLSRGAEGRGTTACEVASSAAPKILVRIEQLGPANTPCVMAKSQNGKIIKKIRVPSWVFSADPQGWHGISSVSFF
jgi:hypothetical protein